MKIRELIELLEEFEGQNGSDLEVSILVRQQSHEYLHSVYREEFELRDSIVLLPGCYNFRK